MHRAAHQVLDRPLVFEDPLALAILGHDAEAELSQPGDWHGFASPGLRAFIVGRSRLAEDLLGEAIGRGTSQYVVLGAGLDTYAYRQGSRPLAIFEIDHPATQAWKRARLEEAGIINPSAIFVPIDFEAECLQNALCRAGFDFSRPAFVAWLGVTSYLARGSVMETLATVGARFAKGSEIVFDYAEPAGEWDPAHRPRLASLSRRVAAAGEPLRSFFEPQGLARDVAALGFSKGEDWDASALNARYFSERADGLRIAGRAHSFHARL
jgi:methyltransferase (TIGR00027 family)